MLKAVLFDFDGVLVDSEPLHLATLQAVLADLGLSLSEDEYVARYLSLDDRGCFAQALASAGREVDDALVAELVRRKAERFRERAETELAFFSGAVDFVRRCAAQYLCAIASGALREEIEWALTRANLLSCFVSLVAAEDVVRGKPDPEAFRAALDALRERGATPPAPNETLVVEDSVNGVAAAHACGMKCLAVTSSCEAQSLRQADLVVDTLEGLRLSEVEALFVDSPDLGRH